MAKSPRRWRISPDGAPHPFVLLGKDAAYERVRMYANRGEGVTVERWKDGGWALYERIEPTTARAEAFNALNEVSFLTTDPDAED
jgi:hypothetical protein